ncbi:MAG: SCP2 sterol-binding domain-containing protein [Candidatus Thorarchaeota archaeon]
MSEDLLTLMKQRIAVGLEREDTRKALEGWKRVALLSLKDGQKFTISVDGPNIEIVPGEPDQFDMKIESDEETVRKLFLEEMSAAAALLKRKLKIKGSALDLMKIRKIF